MKNHLLLTFFAVVFLIPGYTPLQAQCFPGTASADLQENFVKARIRNTGDLWWDGTNGLYIAPAGGQSSAIFAGSMWLGAYDPGGNLKVAGQAYGAATSNVDFWPGPLNSDGTTTSVNCTNWNKLFSITSTDIKNHKTDWATDHVINGPTPNSVKGWPAKGNPLFTSVHGFQLPAGTELAPFYDRDGDGLYDSQKGDFPIAKGDKAYWWVYNDAGGIHGETGGAPLKMEIQASAFAYNTGGDEVELSTLYEYKFVYKGSEPLTDFYASIWVDPDLGCYSDDYIGCLPDENLGFVYNGDNLDENCFGLIGYGTSIPVLGIKVLKPLSAGNTVLSGLNKFTYYFNAGNSGQPPALTDPATPQEYYNYMSGKWRDGTSFSKGGNGYNPGAPAYDYVFDGNPSENNVWTECSNNSVPGDRRLLMSFGPVNLEPGAVTELAFAVVFVPSQAHPCPNVSTLVDYSNTVKEYYEAQCEALLTGTKDPAASHEVTFLPNPMADAATLTVNSPDLLFQEVQLFNSEGRLVRRYAELNDSKLLLLKNELLNGVYFYRAILNNGKIAGGKFVIIN